MPKFEKSPPWLVEIFDGLAASLPGERKLMFGCPSLFLNGHLYCGIFESTLFVKLSEEDQRAMLALDGAAPFDPLKTGRASKKHVVAPRDLLEDDRELRAWLDKSIRHVSALPPKLPKQRVSKTSAAAPAKKPGAAVAKRSAAKGTTSSRPSSRRRRSPSPAPAPSPSRRRR